MMNENRDKLVKLMNHMDEMGIYIDWVAVLMRDLIEDYLMPLAHDCTGKDYEAIHLIWTEADPMATKGEMVERYLGEIADHYRAMMDIVFSPQPTRNHKDMTRDERIAEIMGDITRSVEQIAERPDWLDCMKHLNMYAAHMAEGTTNPSTYTMKE